MELINLLNKKDRSIKDRKKLMRYVLLAFAYACLLYSVTSGFFFIEATLLPFSLPFAVVGLIGVVTAILIDIGQSMSVTNLAIDYFEDKVVEPFTVLIALAFICLSGYISISGTQTRHDKVSLESVRSDSTNNTVASVLSLTTPTVNKVVKTKDLGWLEYQAEVEQAKLSAKQAELHKEQLAAAGKLSDKLEKKKAKEDLLVSKLFNASAWTLILIQIVYLFCMFGAGYYKVATGSGSSGPTKRKNISFKDGPREPLSDFGERAKVNHLGNYTVTKHEHKREHKDCVSTEAQSIVSGSGVCVNCGQSFVPKHPKQKFCSNKGPSNCKDQFNNKNR
jgi:hypothetical protein